MMRGLGKYAVILLCLTVQSAWGTKFVNFEKDASQIDTIYSDDIFISGFKIKFDSRVYGDLFAFCYEIVQSDTVDGNFMAFAQEVQNLGPVTGSFRAFARKVSCNTEIGRNLLIGGQDINIGPGARILRDADLWGEIVVFQGGTDGDLKIKSHTAVISGVVGGALYFEGDSLTINPNTVINGDLNYNSPSRATISDAVTINGEVNWKKTEESKSAKDDDGGFWAILTWIASVKGYLIWNIFSSLLVLIFILIPFPVWLVLITFWFILVAAGNLTLLITKARAYATEAVLGNRLFPSMGLGFIIFFLTPIVAIVLFFTLLLAPLAMVLSMLFGIAVFAGGIYISLYVGRRICLLFGQGAKNTPGFLCYTIGMSVLLILSLIPILGYLIILVSLLTGVGALVQTFWRPKSRPNTVAEATV